MKRKLTESEQRAVADYNAGDKENIPMTHTPGPWSACLTRFDKRSARNQYNGPAFDRARAAIAKARGVA